MSVGPDDGLRALVRDHVRAVLGSPVHWVSLESASTAAGIPDLVGTWRGRTAWVECKATRYWALGSLTAFQVGHALALARCGGTCWVLTRRRGEARGAAAKRRGGAVGPYDELWLHPGATAVELRRGGLLAVFPHLRAGGGPARWPWEELGRRVFGVGGDSPVDAGG